MRIVAGGRADLHVLGAVDAPARLRYGSGMSEHKLPKPPRVDISPAPGAASTKATPLEMATISMLSERQEKLQAQLELVGVQRTEAIRAVARRLNLGDGNISLAPDGAVTFTPAAPPPG